MEGLVKKFGPSKSQMRPVSKPLEKSNEDLKEVEPIVQAVS